MGGAMKKMFGMAGSSMSNKLSEKFKVNELTQNEYDSLLRKSGIQGSEGAETNKLMESEKLIGQNRKILFGKNTVDNEKSKTLIQSIIKRDQQLSQAKQYAFGTQTGAKRG